VEQGPIQRAGKDGNKEDEARKVKGKRVIN
jgi:hypothetical protein